MSSLESSHTYCSEQGEVCIKVSWLKLGICCKANRLCCCVTYLLFWPPGSVISLPLTYFPPNFIPAKLLISLTWGWRSSTQHIQLDLVLPLLSASHQHIYVLYSCLELFPINYCGQVRTTYFRDLQPCSWRPTLL